MSSLSSNGHTKTYLGLFAQCVQYLVKMNVNQRFGLAWFLLSVYRQDKCV